MSPEYSFRDAYKEVGDALGGQVLPDNEYEVRVKSARADQTAGGKQCFKLVLEVLSPGPQQGKSVPDQLTWSPESDVAARIFSQTLRMLGAPREWIDQNNPSPDQIAERISGAQAIVGLTSEEWQGALRNRVRYQRSTGTGGGVSTAAPAGGNGGSGGAQAVTLGSPEPAAAQQPATVGGGSATDDPFAEFRAETTGNPASSPTWP